MSGGAFDYAFHDAAELKKTLVDMELFLAKSDAPIEATAELVALEKALERNEDLLKAVEWYASGDWGPEAVEDIIEQRYGGDST